MRFKKKPKAYFNIGDTRKVTKFLLLPKTIGYETRWLETTTYVERCEWTVSATGADVAGWVAYMWYVPDPLEGSK